MVGDLDLRQKHRFLEPLPALFHRNWQKSLEKPEKAKRMG